MRCINDTKDRCDKAGSLTASESGFSATTDDVDTESGVVAPPDDDGVVRDGAEEGVDGAEPPVVAAVVEGKVLTVRRCSPFAALLPGTSDDTALRISPVAALIVLVNDMDILRLWDDAVTKQPAQ
jgi:hypothetical protein